MQHFFADRLGPRPSVVISGQRERRPAFTVAGNAMRVEQPDNLPVDSYLGSDDIVAVCQRAGPRQDANHQKEKTPSHHHRS